MAGSVKAYCGICLQWTPLESFYALPCGHGLCEGDLASLIQHKPSNRRHALCPECRTSFNPNAKHRIYHKLRASSRSHSVSGDPNSDFDPPSSSRPTSPKPRDYDESQGSGSGGVRRYGYSEAVHRQAQHTTSCIQRINERSSATTIQRTRSEIRKVTDGMADDEDDKVRALLNALSDLVNRIAPVFSSVSSLESQLTILRNQLTEAEEKNNDLEATNIHSESILQKTLDTAAQATHECTNLRNDVQTLRAEKEALGRRKDEEIGKMKGKVRGLVDKVAIYESKEKRCKARIAKLESHLSSGQQYIAHLEETSRVAVQEKTALETQLQFQTYNHEYNASLPSLHTSDYDGLSTRHESQYEGSSKSFVDLDHEDENSLDSFSSSSPVSRTRPLGRSLKSLPSSHAHSQISLQRPKFGTDWNLDVPGKAGAGTKRKRLADDSETISKFPIARDAHGKITKPVVLGSRVKMNRFN